MGVEAQVGLSIAILFLWTFLNFFNVSQVGFINNIAAFVQVASVFIMIVGLMSAARQLSTAEFVFFNYYDGTGWNSQPYVLAIGLLGPLYSFSGYEASAHMAEETQGSRTAAPYGIIFTCLATGAVGMGYLLALLFAARSVDEALDGPTDNAVVNVFINAGGDAVGAAFAWLIALNLFFAGTPATHHPSFLSTFAIQSFLFPMLNYGGLSCSRPRQQRSPRSVRRYQQRDRDGPHNVCTHARWRVPVFRLLGQSKFHHQIPNQVQIPQPSCSGLSKEFVSCFTPHLVCHSSLMEIMSFGILDEDVGATEAPSQLLRQHIKSGFISDLQPK